MFHDVVLLGAGGIGFRDRARPRIHVPDILRHTGGIGNARIVSISTTPCDFSQPWPWTRAAYNTGIQFTVAPIINRSLPTLQPGTSYYLNVANRDAFGLSTCIVSCDIRINATRGN
jgi:hypothetical protein